MENKKCSFCEGNLFLDGNACCLTCGKPIHEIENRRGCKDDQEYNIKLWNQAKRRFEQERKWKKESKLRLQAIKEKYQMHRLKEKLRKWYRLYKNKELVLKPLSDQMWECPICNELTNKRPFALELFFENSHNARPHRAWVSQIICHRCKRRTDKLVRLNKIPELLDIMKRGYKEK